MYSSADLPRHLVFGLLFCSISPSHFLSQAGRHYGYLCSIRVESFSSFISRPCTRVYCSPLQKVCKFLFQNPSCQFFVPFSMVRVVALVDVTRPAHARQRKAFVFDRQVSFSSVFLLTAHHVDPLLSRNTNHQGWVACVACVEGSETSVRSVESEGTLELKKKRRKGDKHGGRE